MVGKRTPSRSDDYRQGVLALPPPPAGFDPAKATPAMLERHGFPRRPDARLAPQAYRLWRRAFTPQTSYAGFGITEQLVPQDSVSTPDDQAVGGLAGAWLTSRNWSGLVNSPHDLWRFAGVTGTWTVPRTLTVPPGTTPVDDKWRCSAWLGLDGMRLQAPAIPQIGTDHTIDTSGVITHRAWVQWFAEAGNGVPRGGIGPYPIMNFPISGGDLMLGFVTVETPNQVALALVNLSTAPPVAALIRLSSAGFKDPAAFRVMGSSAEWIVERPTFLPPTGAPPGTPAPPYPLPDFGTIALDPGYVLTWRKPGDPISIRPPGAFREIAMYDIRPGPSRTVTLARPHLAPPGGTVRYTG